MYSILKRTDRLDISRGTIPATRSLYGTFDVEIEIISTGEKIRVASQLYDYATKSQGLEEINFNDGVTWSRDEIAKHTLTLDGDANGERSGTEAADNIYGFGGNDTLSGADGDDLLIGGLGSDTLRGGTGTAAQDSNGSDTFLWSAGDGNDTIQEYAGSFAEVDTLRFEDITSADVALTRLSGTADIEIEVLSTGEKLTVVSQLHDYATVSQGLEQIVFSDGITWSRDDIAEKIQTFGDGSDNSIVGTEAGDNIFGLDGNDTIEGGYGNDALIGGAGADVLTGGNGSDILTGSVGSDQFKFAANDGADTITDFEVNSDLIVFDISGLTFEDLTLTEAGGDTVVNYGSGAIELTDIAATALDEQDFLFA